MPDENNNQESHSTLDKIVMGAIIGTAIGSAIGVTLAPKKGAETRKILKTSEAKEVLKLSKEILHGLGKIAKRIFLGKKSSKPDGFKKIPDESSVEIIENEKKKTSS